MRHPFDGIIVPESQSTPAEAAPTRRSVLGRLLAAAVGLGGLMLGTKAQAQIATTLAIGEEGGTTLRRGEEGGVITTQAIGEEGATTKRLGEEGAITTRARGEEGIQPPIPPPPITTFARGEEGTVTTQAIGEEGGFTTQALGEEGAGRS